MENILKKRLTRIKARAHLLRRFYGTGGDELQPKSTDEADELHENLKKARPLFIGNDSDIAEAPSLGVAGLGSGWSGQRDFVSWRLEELVRGEEYVIEGRPFYLIRLRGSEIDGWAKREALQFRSLKGDPVPRENMPGEKRVGPDPLGPSREKACFFDIETTGLSPSTYVFLCGMMFLDGCDFVLEQALARDYEEEGGILRYVKERFKFFETLITYNGKTFDIPFVQTRMAVNRIDFEEFFTHLDLLGFARRAYSGSLENCRLGTVERYLRGESRTGDIPGSQIPSAYHAFVRTGEAGVMERILYHNRMDLLTMAILYNKLWPGGAHR